MTKKKLFTIITMLTLLAITVDIPYFSFDTVKATGTQEDWDRTNDNYTGFASSVYSLTATDDFIYVLSWTGGTLTVPYYVLWRSNFTLYGTGVLTGFQHINPSAKVIGEYLYAGGKYTAFGGAAGCGVKRGKFHIPDMTLVDTYLNTSWDNPQYISTWDTYFFNTGSKDYGITGLIKINTATMEEEVPTVGYDYTATDYNYRSTSSLDGYYLYVCFGCKNNGGGISKHYASNLTRIDYINYGTYYSMQHIITVPVSGNIITASAGTGSPYRLTCYDTDLTQIWNIGWTGGAEDGIAYMCPYNQSNFIAFMRPGVITNRYTANGGIVWNYTGFSGSQEVYFDTYQNYLYAVGLYDGGYVLRNITIDELEETPPAPPLDIHFNSINEQANDTQTTEVIYRFNWSRAVTTEYNLIIANDSDFTDIILNLSSINEINYGDYYSETSEYVLFILPEIYRKAWIQKYYFKVRYLVVT
jgi:hypothetical protein